MQLEQLGPGLWVKQIPYKTMGISYDRQIVAVRLSSGGLWIHSPIPVTESLRSDLAALGKVEHVVGPNRYHDECLGEFQAEYPDATFHAAPGLAKIRKDVRFSSAELGDVAPSQWRDVLDQHLVSGMPSLNEVIFFHRPSRSLIIADIAFKLAGERPWFSRMLLKATGSWSEFRPSRFCKRLMKDKSQVRESIKHIETWDFERIIAGHGQNITVNAKAQWHEAFAFLFEVQL